MSCARFPLRPIVLATTLALQALGAAAQMPSPTEAAGTLPAVKVEASADASAEGLPKPYAGGQVARGGRVGILGNQDIMNTPFLTNSYTTELIQDQQAQSVADVLLNDPSVRTARSFGNFQELYVIRGFPVYSDDVGYNGLYGMLPRQYIASEFFERVEVFHGANTFVNGAGPAGSNLGGAINLLPKRAPNEPLNRVAFGIQTGGQASLTADFARRFGPDQSTGIRVIAARRDGGTGVDNEKRELSALGVGLDWRSRSVRFSADVGYQDHDLREGRPSVTPAANLPIPRPPSADANFAQSWTYSRERDTFGTVRSEFDLSDDVTAWAAAGVRRSTESNSLSNPAVTSIFGDTQASRFDNERKDRVTTGEVGVRARFATGSVGHTVSASAATLDNARRNAYGVSGTTVLSNLYFPIDRVPPLATVFTGGALRNPLVTDEVKTKSIAVADTMSFANERVLLTVGARRQSIEQNSFDYDTGAFTSGYDQAKTTPVAGIVFKPSAQISLYANYIEGLIKGDTAPIVVSGRPVTNGGQTFPPFAAKQKEIGAKYDGGNFGANLAFFTTDQPSYFVQNDTFGPYGKQRNRGIELSLFGEPAKGLRVLGGLTLLDATQRRTPGGVTDGNDAIGVPKQQFNLGMDWDVPGVRGLALNARVVHTSKQYADAANTLEVPGWTRFDAGARYLMDIGSGRMLTLRARIDNLFNKSYWASAGGYPGTNYLVQGAPRTLVVSGTIDF
jgi:iron complex outermembrane receptor protein